MRNFDLIAFDLDGTVFSHPVKQETSERVARAFAAAHEAGVTLAVASGRPKWMLGPQIPNAPWMSWAIGGNGSMVVPIGGNTAADEGFGLPIKREIALPFMHKIEQLEGGITTHTQNTSLHDPISMERFSHPNEDMIAELKARGNDVSPDYNPISEVMKTFKFEQVDCISAAYEANPELQVFKFDIDLPSIEATDEAVAYAHELGGLEVARVGSRTLEVTADGSSKGNGVTWLCEHLGIDPKRVVCFGDSGNDLSMSGRDFTFVAMGNAPDHIKAAADEVCDCVANDGVAQWIEARL